MNQSADTITYNDSYEPPDLDQHPTPFLKKEWVRIPNDGGAGADFNRNELKWNTITVSNNGKMTDYKNAYLEIPVVCTLFADDVGADLSAVSGINALRMKSAHAIIDSLAIEYNNTTIVQARRGITPWVSFKEHSTYGQDDVLLAGSTYTKPSEHWLYSNSNGLQNWLHHSPEESSPLYHIGQNAGALSSANIESSGMDYYEYTPPVVAGAGVARVPAKHVYYFTVRIHLKKLICFESLPLVRGANLTVTCTFNQYDATTTYSTDTGTITGITSSIKGSCCPVYIARADPPAAATLEHLSVKLVRNGTISHKKSTCDLVIPCYTMEANAERDYLSVGTKLVKYTDVHIIPVSGRSGDISEMLVNSVTKLKRLIVVPMLSRHQPTVGANMATPQQTPYCLEPACCSPYQISNFNVLLSGVPVYEGGGVKYKYDMFENELKGKFGPLSGSQVGLATGQISEYAYNNTMGYLCVDLSRRQASDFDTPVSVQIQCQLNSPLNIDLMCFIEIEKSITIDLMTSELV